MLGLQDRVVGLDEQACVEGRVGREQRAQDGDCRVGGRVNAKADRQAVARVVLLEGRGEALAQVVVEALDGADDGDMRGG
jgi:hypothetical protein